MTFADRLKALNLRQTELAQILCRLSEQHVPVGTVNRWCVGTRKPPASVLAFVRLLELDSDWLTTLRQQIAEL